MRTTPILGLKLYDPTDAPDLVSGYNASMGTLDEKRLFRYLGTLQNSSIDLNDCHETGYWNNYDHDFTEADHGPVGSFSRGILVVYDKCNGESAQGKCLRQEYYPEPYGTGDAYRPMVRTLNSDTGTWTAWKPLVDVPEVPDNILTMPSNGSVLKNGGAVYNMTIGPSGGGDGSSSWANTYLRFNANGHTPTFTVGSNGGVLDDIYSINGVQLATAAITSEEEMQEFLVGADTRYGAWVGSGTVTHGKLYAGYPTPCACNAFRQDNVNALNLVITGITSANLDISTFQIVVFGKPRGAPFTLRGIILTYNEDGGAPTQTLIRKFSDLRGINLKLSRIANS